MRNLLAIAVALAASACDRSTGHPNLDMPMAPDMAVMPAPFGLDARPANPTCVAPPRPVSTTKVAVTRAFPALTFAQPIFLLQAPGDNTRWFVLEQGGIVKTFPDLGGAPTASTNFLDITARVASGGEAGLLGMAFDPNWQTTHRVYIDYTTPSAAPAGFSTTISRFTSADGGLTLDPASEQVLLTIDKPETNHNGGGILFGPDGYLYIGTGDGGGGGDAHGTIGNGQDTSVLLGKFLRIDVSTTGATYNIPPTNPFASAGGRPEIYAYGVRNPWRWSFDRATGELWLGDVGQNLWEEVDRIQLGGNYGWRIMEGTHCYNPSSGCNMAGLIQPLVDYPHANGDNCIIGGYVYRGTAIPSLIGTYLYSDNGSGRVWGLTEGGAGMPVSSILIDTTGESPSSFGEGNDGELYLVGHGSGQLFKFVAATGNQNGTFPATLSATGCVDRTDATRPAPGLIPYDLNAPFWSDGASKRRFMALPDGQKIHINAEGHFDFPNGTVLMKEFSLAGKRIETRLFVRHTDGGWAGYSYEWNDAGTDANLLPAGKVKTVGTQSWTFPSRGECVRCHTAAAGYSLGPEVGQLHRDLAYPNGRLSPELDTLVHIGLFDAPLDVKNAVAYPAYDGPQPVALRARAYLHANCSICHRPTGPGQSNADLRFATGFKQMGVCGVAPIAGDLGVASAALLTPANPGKSILSLRPHATDVNRMPPVASHVVDAQGTALIDQWITGVLACP